MYKIYYRLVRKLLICHEVRYDGETISLYDADDNRLVSSKAKLFQGLPEVVKKSGGNHIQILSDVEALVINPRILTHLSPTDGWGWYVRNCMMQELGYIMFTAWKPYYVSDSTFAQRGSTSLSPTGGSPGSVCRIVPSIKSTSYIEHCDDIALVPLLETIIQVDQALSGMTLCQIACSVAGRFRAEFNKIERVMEFLFDHFKTLFAELCIKENVPIQRLYQSDFNVTFGHNKHRYPVANRISVVKKLHNVLMIPLSNLVSDKTYGNIPWLISESRERDQLERKAKFIVQPFGFFENTVQYSELQSSILFSNVCILPEITVQYEQTAGGHLQETYQAGAVIGIVVYDDESKDTVMRGELFEGTTTREQLILTLMFGAFVDGQLQPGVDYSDLLRNLRLEADQLPVRKEYIRAIQCAFFTGS